MAGPKITPSQFNIFSQRIADIYVALENTVFETIAKRLKATPEAGTDYVLQWQIEKLRQLNALNLETIEELSKTTGIAKEEILKLFEEVGFGSIGSIDSQLAMLGKAPLPPPNNITAILNTFVQQVFLELDNFVNQTLITTNYGEGAITTMYRKIVEETTSQVLVGNKTINAAMTETIIRWREKGVASGFVDRGGRTWSLEPYVNMVLRSTVNRTYNELRMSRMDDYGVDLVRVNSYSNARPACAKIQGGIASMKSQGQNTSKYPSIYQFGYGEPDGVRGISCRHILTPYIEGVSENNEVQVPEEKAEKEYELTQKQRYLERQIRKSKEALRLAETTGDEASIEKYKKQIRNRQATLRNFLAETGLPRQRLREQIV